MGCIHHDTKPVNFLAQQHHEEAVTLSHDDLPRTARGANNTTTETMTTTSYQDFRTARGAAVLANVTGTRS